MALPPGESNLDGNAGQPRFRVGAAT